MSLEGTYATIDNLASLGPDLISVTYGAGGTSRDNTVRGKNKEDGQGPRRGDELTAGRERTLTIVTPAPLGARVICGVFPGLSRYLKVF